MKKQLLILSVILCAPPTLANMTHEDALASSADYYNHLKAVNKSPANEGLGPEEFQDSNTANQMGKWVKVGGSAQTTSAGEYSTILAPTSEGKTCLKGDKGLIIAESRECVQWNSGGWHCVKYGPNTVNIESGDKAECK